MGEKKLRLITEEIRYHHPFYTLECLFLFFKHANVCLCLWCFRFRPLRSLFALCVVFLRYFNEFDKKNL